MAVDVVIKHVCAQKFRLEVIVSKSEERVSTLTLVTGLRGEKISECQWPFEEVDWRRAMRIGIDNARCRFLRIERAGMRAQNRRPSHRGEM